MRRMPRVRPNSPSSFVVFTVVFVNAGHVKVVPGRKTDVRDSELLLELMQHGLIQGSFIPEARIHALRNLTRFRTNLIEERARAINRIQKMLEYANVKLASVVTEVLGVSGRAMLEAMIAGEEDPETLANLARGTSCRKHVALVEALNGRVRDHHRLYREEGLMIRRSSPGPWTSGTIRTRKPWG